MPGAARSRQEGLKRLTAKWRTIHFSRRLDTSSIDPKPNRNIMCYIRGDMIRSREKRLTFDRVTTVQKQEARDLFRLAKRRGFRLALTKEQLNDPAELGRCLAIYGTPPSDREFRRAARIAKCLKAKLTLEQAMNRWHCRKFINDNKHATPGGPPSAELIKSAIILADRNNKRVPEEGFVSAVALQAFFDENWGDEERDVLQEIVNEFAIKVDFSNPQSMAETLRRWEPGLRDPATKLEFKKERIRHLLSTGHPPDGLADALNVDERIVFECVDELEAEGFEIAYCS